MLKFKKVDDQTIRKLNIDGGLRIKKLSSGKLKRHTDIRSGFIITKVDGKKTGSVDEFIKYMEQADGGVMLEGVYEDIPGTYYYAFGL